MFYFCLLLIHESIGFGFILTDLDIIVILKYRIGRIFIESGLGVDRSRLKWKIEARIIVEYAPMLRSRDQVKICNVLFD